MSSPFIPQFSGETSRKLKGKVAVEAYWRTALEPLSSLRFVVRRVFIGVSSVMIHYQTSFNQQVAGVFFFNEQGLIERAFGYYADLATAGETCEP